MAILWELLKTETAQIPSAQPAVEWLDTTIEPFDESRQDDAAIVPTYSPLLPLAKSLRTMVQYWKHQPVQHTSEAIRSVLLSSRTVGLLPLSELLLYYAARNQNVCQNIIPAQGQGKWILCDRFADASAAYQGYGRGIDLSLVKFLNSTVIQGNNPDLTLLIDINPVVALSRARKRNRQLTVDEGRFEQESLEFYQRVRQGYLQIARREPHRVHILDGNQPIENIQEEIVRLISPLLP